MTTNELTTDLSYFLHHLLIMYLYSFNLSPYHHIISSQPYFFFSLSKNLKQCFVENNAQLQKLYLSTRQKQVLFFIYTEIFYGSALLILKIYDLHPLGKNTEDLKLDWCLDQRKITSYIMFRTIYLQFVFLINWNISHAISLSRCLWAIIYVVSSPRVLWQGKWTLSPGHMKCQ